jgi:hypothetical protein
MAICLDDIRKSKNEKKEKKEVLKTRSLRPWETYESLGPQTRTIRAQEAVLRARKIVERNNEMVKALRGTKEIQTRFENIDLELEEGREISQDWKKNSMFNKRITKKKSPLVFLEMIFSFFRKKQGGNP